MPPQVSDLPRIDTRIEFFLHSYLLQVAWWQDVRWMLAYIHRWESQPRRLYGLFMFIVNIRNFIQAEDFSEFFGLVWVKFASLTWKNMFFFLSNVEVIAFPTRVSRRILSHEGANISHPSTTLSQMKSLKPQKHSADVQCQRRPWSSNIHTCFKNRPATLFYGILKINILK